MLREDFIAILEREPFQPFRITTTNNEVVDVRQPQMVMVAGDDITVGVGDAVLPAPAASRLLWLGFDNIISAEPIHVSP